MLGVLLGILMIPSNPAILTVPVETVDPIVTQKEVWMGALAKCESGGDPTIKVWDTNQKWSIGKYQYQYATWAKYATLFGTTKDNISDGDLQDKVTRYILDTKGTDDWFNCSKIVVSELGKYPTQ